MPLPRHITPRLIAAVRLMSSSNQPNAGMQHKLVFAFSRQNEQIRDPNNQFKALSISITRHPRPASVRSPSSYKYPPYFAPVVSLLFLNFTQNCSKALSSLKWPLSPLLFDSLPSSRSIFSL